MGTKPLNYKPFISSEQLDSDIEGFQKLAELLQLHAGIKIILNDKNKSLLSSRLMKILRKYDFKNYFEYSEFLKKADESTISEFISAMTTNTTEFFRENRHFDFIRQYFSQKENMAQIKKQNELLIWCAATSSGQEIYSIIMTLLNIPYFQENSQIIKALATDIDQKILKFAANGIYEPSSLRGVNSYNLLKYFNKSKSSQGMKYQVKEELYNLITFAPMNLLSNQYEINRQFDFIFCRNVLIYFEGNDINKVIENLTRQLKMGGLLFVGHSEGGLVKHSGLKKIAYGVYKKVVK